MDFGQFAFILVCLFIGYVIGYAASLLNQPVAGKFIIDDKNQRGFMGLTMPEEEIGEYRTVHIRIEKGDLSEAEDDSQESQGL